MFKQMFIKSCSYFSSTHYWWLYILIMYGRPTASSYKIYTSLFLSKKLQWCVRETEIGRQIQTPILTHNFFFAAMCNLQGLTSSLSTRGTQPVLGREAASPRSSGHSSLSPDWTDYCKLALTDWDPLHTETQDWPYLKWVYAYIISLRPHISVQSRDCFRLFSPVRPEQRISDWRLGQGSICNTRTVHK